MAPSLRTSTPTVVPCELPVEHADLPALGGRIGPEPEDFVVDEVPLYAASGDGEHWYVRLRKRAATTLDLVRDVARAANVPERDVGYAGMKDKHAVTTQWLSLPARALAPESWQLGEAYALLETTRHVNKLRTGHLAANRFAIRLVDLGPDAAVHIAPLAERIESRGVGNYFGAQRFGLGQRNLESGLLALARRRFGPRSGNRGKFLASVIQSEVFNRYLVARTELGRERLLDGDVVRLAGSRSLFVVDDAAREQERLTKRDIHLTGPMVGPKMRQSHGRPLELELEAAASLGLSPEDLAELGRSAPGTRRDAVLWPETVRYEAQPDGSIVLSFTLQAGAYASLVVRAFTRSDPWLGSEGDSGSSGGRMEHVD